MKIYFLLTAVALASASQDADGWERWKKKFNKTYNSEEEELYRHTVWTSNKKYIEGHNAHADLWGYEVGINQFADMNATEFSKLIVGPSSMYIFSEEQQTASEVFVSSESVEDLPKSVDWRKKGYVTRVKNQGRCAAGYAFSATGSFEAQNFIKTGKLVPLSEQNIIDCSGIYHNNGCKGGKVSIGLMYGLIKGIDTEKSYPYRSQDGVSYECQFNNKTIGARANTTTTFNSRNELDLQKKVATVAPISVTIDAAHIGFQFYKRGVYHSYFCSSWWLNHAVLVVGYGVDHSKDYWLVKNSWGRSWGIKGYVKMSRNRRNNCGIATVPYWPNVKPWP